MFPVQLDSFPKLKHLMYGSPIKGFVLPYTVRQLKAASSTSELIGVYFDIRVDHGHQLDEDLCKVIDNLLVGDKFPSLGTVGLHKTIAPELFPELSRSQRLLFPDGSFWIDVPPEKETSDGGASTKDDDEDKVEVEESTQRTTEMTGEDDTLAASTTNDASYPL